MAQGESTGVCESLWRRDEQDNWERRSEDPGCNGLTESFLQFIKVCSLTILNGTRRFSGTQRCTCRAENGESLVDYILATQTSRECVASFELGPFTPESDHRSLTCTLTGFEKTHKVKSNAPLRLQLDKTSKGHYEQEIALHIQDFDFAASISRTIVCTAKKVFPRKGRQASWFDIECRDARLKALGMDGEDQKVAFRGYKQLVKAKKRCFLREHQKRLTSELMQEPQHFWRRLRPKKDIPVLAEDDLIKYVTQLHNFPTAAVMPEMGGVRCVFQDAEVEKGLHDLGTGKASDLSGLSAELVRWGGPFLLSHITRIVNQACQTGLPEEWNYCRVVPLYKAGPRTSPQSYRTIMVSSIFSKLLGWLLETRLSVWCEQMGDRAPAQTGFRRSYSTSDHTVVLHVIMEQARRHKKQLFVLYVDFSKAFDSVPRYLIWQKLVNLGVPQDLVNTVVSLYSQVLVRLDLTSPTVESNLGVIQGCPLSPTLFGLIVDDLFWMLEGATAGVQLGTSTVPALLFADDVAILATSEEELRFQITILEDFCKSRDMSVNLSKTRWMSIGASPGTSFLFQGRPIEQCYEYKYLGLEFSAKRSWSRCVKARAAHGLTAVFSLWNKCRRAELTSCQLKLRLFDTLVLPVVLYNAPTWGPSTSRSGWHKLESVHKTFLQTELGIRPQVPYVLMLAETGRLPVEAEALLLSIRFALRLRSQADDRYGHQAWTTTRGQDWYAKICQWGAKWGIPEPEWQSADLRKITNEDEDGDKAMKPEEEEKEEEEEEEEEEHAVIVVRKDTMVVSKKPITDGLSIVRQTAVTRIDSETDEEEQEHFALRSRRPTDSTAPTISREKHKATKSKTSCASACSSSSKKRNT
ncbi:hypothetical protein R1sor_001300 [Riccia sorocarpa]|uniref:Reverse transcriptase domain-containing protein n=1 Tax=Riccia sorocarpa TaxID=122646 RepID=A0ABD3GVW1_9MARC